jgi:hypothetical protein
MKLVLTVFFVLLPFSIQAQAKQRLLAVCKSQSNFYIEVFYEHVPDYGSWVSFQYINYMFPIPMNPVFVPSPRVTGAGRILTIQSKKSGNLDISFLIDQNKPLVVNDPFFAKSGRQAFDSQIKIDLPITDKTFETEGVLNTYCYRF